MRVGKTGVAKIGGGQKRVLPKTGKHRNQITFPEAMQINLYNMFGKLIFCFSQPGDKRFILINQSSKSLLYTVHRDRE